MNYIYALRIKLDREVTQRTDLGLYTADGESYFRWSELPLVGFTDTYLSGVVQNIGAITKRGNFRTGGGTATAEGFSVTIFNNNQLTLRLAELNISLTGLVCEVLEFVGTDADSDSVEIYPQYTGIIEDVTAWNPLTLTFNVKTARHKRRANLLTADSVVAPVTYGSSDPANGRYFKAVRTLTVNKILSLNEMKAAGGTVYPETMKLFPIYSKVGSSPSLVYQVQLGMMDATALPNANFFNDKYILIKKGKGGTHPRRIHNCSVIATGTNAIIQIELYDYLEEDMVGNSSGTAEDQTWIQFADIDREYELDELPCNGFYNSDGVKINNGAELFAVDGETVLRIPGYGYDVDQDNHDNNSLIIDPKLFDSDPDNLYSFTILPVKSISRATSAEYAIHYGATYMLGNGVFGKGPGITSAANISVTESGSLDNVKDKDSTSYYELNSSFDVEPDQLSEHIHAFKIVLPRINQELSFKNVYLLMQIVTQSSLTGSTDGVDNVIPYIMASKRGYIDMLSRLLSGTIGEIVKHNASTGVSTIDNLPDFYPNVNRNLKNIQFFTATNVPRGYKCINLNVANLDDYQEIENILLYISKWNSFPYGDTVETFTENTKIYEMCVAFESTASIKTEVYV